MGVISRGAEVTRGEVGAEGTFALKSAEKGRLKKLWLGSVAGPEEAAQLHNRAFKKGKLKRVARAINEVELGGGNLVSTGGGGRG